MNKESKGKKNKMANKWVSTAAVTNAIMTGNPLVKIVVNDTSTRSKLDAQRITNLEYNLTEDRLLKENKGSTKRTLCPISNVVVEETDLLDTQIREKQYETFTANAMMISKT